PNPRLGPRECSGRRAQAIGFASLSGALRAVVSSDPSRRRAESAGASHPAPVRAGFVAEERHLCRLEQLPAAEPTFTSVPAACFFANTGVPNSLLPAPWPTRSLGVFFHPVLGK